MQTKEKRRLWRAKNRIKILEQRRIWRIKNKDKVAESHKRDYEKNKNTYIKYRIRNVERIRLYNKEYLNKNREILRKKQIEYRKNNPDKVLKWENKSREIGRVGHFLSSIKKNSKARGLEFTLTKQWIQERFDKGICELSGIKFDMVNRRSKNSPSIDRINPNGGYTIENCRMITWALNRALCNYGQEYFFDIFEKILRKVKPEIFIGDSSI